MQIDQQPVVALHLLAQLEIDLSMPGVVIEKVASAGPTMRYTLRYTKHLDTPLVQQSRHPVPEGEFLAMDPRYQQRLHEPSSPIVGCRAEIGGTVIDLNGDMIQVRHLYQHLQTSAAQVVIVVMVVAMRQPSASRTMEPARRSSRCVYPLDKRSLLTHS